MKQAFENRSIKEAKKAKEIEIQANKNPFQLKLEERAEKQRLVNFLNFYFVRNFLNGVLYIKEHSHKVLYAKNLFLKWFKGLKHYNLLYDLSHPVTDVEFCK